jgi:uncharacterized repeat protein (TIGR01451 family)
MKNCIYIYNKHKTFAMKKINFSRILLVCSLCIIFSTAHAQYVAIPDSNFGNWLLNNGYSTCMTGNSVSGFQLDTTCINVTSASQVSCSYSNIHDLTGIQYFPNLSFLDCGNNHLTSIPPLPSTLNTLITNNNPLGSLPALLPTWLTTLTTDSNGITVLPALPTGLIYLECNSNPITTLPALPATLQSLTCFYDSLTSLPALPASLVTIYCNSNKLTSLPALPASLRTLYCYDNPLGSLPALPSSLGQLNCDGSQLTSLPVLPSSLTWLECRNNQIRTVPALPASLNYLEISDNPIYVLPTLPGPLVNLFCDNDSLSSLPPLPARLQQIDCGANLLTNLPALPASLVDLYCGGNQITILPALPAGLNTLECSSNKIGSLPALPQGLSFLDCSYNSSLSCLPPIYQNVLQFFFISGTNIQCMPNRFTAVNYQINPDTMPLCGPTSGCDFYYNIAGNIHSDTAATCLSDSINPGTGLGNIKVQLLQGGKVVQQFYTSGSGVYSFKTDSFTDYEVSIDTTQTPFRTTCPTGGIYNVVLSQADSVDWNDNFGMICPTIDKSYGVVGIFGHFRPYYIHPIYVIAGNISELEYGGGCPGAGTSGTVTTAFTGPAQYAGPAPGALTPSIVSGNTLTYNVADLDSLTPNSLAILQYVDSTARVGDLIYFTVIIAPYAPHINPDTLTECFVVQNSNDPNYKDVYPTTLTPEGGWLTYTVEFQNTGNDTAYTVIVKDTLSPNVDASTFQYLASSNKAVVQLFGNAMAFTFPKINLVDSATNAPLSTGWIQYKVKSKPNLPNQTQINNTAYVYFDQNPAVVTNTAVTNVNPTGIRPVPSDNSIHLYPNPNKGTFTLQTSNSINSTYTITDMLGHVITQKTITADRQAIDMPGIAEGVYTLTVRGTSLRFVVFSFQ